jgi:hypothetical protein
MNVYALDVIAPDTLQASIKNFGTGSPHVITSLALENINNKQIYQSIKNSNILDKEYLLIEPSSLSDLYNIGGYSVAMGLVHILEIELTDDFLLARIQAFIEGARKNGRPAEFIFLLYGTTDEFRLNDIAEKLKELVEIAGKLQTDKSANTKVWNLIRTC